MDKKWKKKYRNKVGISQVLVVTVFATSLLSQTSVSMAAVTEETSAQISAAITLAETDLNGNSGTIQILLQQCISMLEKNDPVVGTLQSIMLLLDTGNADAASVTVLLKSIVDQHTGEQVESVSEAENMQSYDMQENVYSSAAQQETEVMYSELGLPIYQVSSLVQTFMPESILVDVPQDWGNNAAGRSLTSYSPINDSGAISPAAGTLTLSYFPMEEATESEAFDSYEKNIAEMSVTTAMKSEDVTTADLPARKLEYTMCVGANVFTCEAVCFAYDQTVYTIELMQGQESEYDYFPTYHQVVDSAQVGTEQQLSVVKSEQGKETLETELETQNIMPVQSEVVVETEVQQVKDNTEQLPNEVSVQTETTDAMSADIGTFMYQVNGHAYQFPTEVEYLAEGDLNLNNELVLPYDFSSDADMAGGYWTEIVNTQYYYFENALHKEMVGVTNMSGYPVSMKQGMLTALIDTQGTYINITLPGGIEVGSSESDILKGFPEFSQMTMDGTAAFRGNELLYACNVRDDGCNGYVLIRNDAPYYSAVSIICENGVIKEISFECLGSVRAAGVFL